ncbi:MAG TPA: phosphoglucosamine mutase [Acidimicrobiia bacterium]|nr:phosphoglucosamine mutase [Acidimicrobiia bacterium]
MTLRFGTDGVRGVANRELTPELVTALGRAAARTLGTDKPFIVGRDTRRSGPMIEAALVTGICAEGADVELLGVVPSPTVAYVAARGGSPGAVISASHNPFDDNGVKLFSAGGKKMSEAIEAQLEALVRELAVNPPEPGPGGAEVGVAQPARDPISDYANHVMSVLEGRTLEDFQVVLDCGNGATFRTVPRIFRELGAAVEVINAAPNGTNINAGCGSTDTSQLQEAVIASGARAGLAFDGDGDRVIAVDERGGIVDGDMIMAVCALDLAERERLKNRAVVGTVMSNLGLRRCLESHELGFVEVPVGDRHVIDELERRDLSLGGEQSGHIIFRDYEQTGDGALTGVMLLDVVVGTGHSLSLLAGVMQRFPQVLRNVPVRDRKALDSASAFWEEATSIEGDLGTEGRILVRPSGTEPVVRVMVEAPSVEQAELIADRLVGAVQRACGAPPPPT